MLMLLARLSGPLRKVPAGISTVPPLAVLPAAALMAAWMAAVLSFVPLTAPNLELVMTKIFVPPGMVGGVGSAKASGADASKARPDTAFQVRNNNWFIKRHARN